MRESSSRLGRSGGGVRGLWSSNLHGECMPGFRYYGLQQLCSGC